MSNIERLIRKAEKAYTGAKPAVLTLTAEQGFELLFALNYSGQAEGYNHIVPAAEIRTVIATHSEEGLRAIFSLLPYDSMKVVIVDDVYPLISETVERYEDNLQYHIKMEDLLTMIPKRKLPLTGELEKAFVIEKKKDFDLLKTHIEFNFKHPTQIKIAQAGSNSKGFVAVAKENDLFLGYLSDWSQFDVHTAEPLTKPLSEEVEVYEIAAREFTYDIKEATRFLERANAQEVLDSDHSLGAEILDCVEYYIVKVTFDDDRTGYLAS